MSLAERERATMEIKRSGRQFFDVRLFFIKKLEHRGTVADVIRVMRQGQAMTRARQFDLKNFADCREDRGPGRSPEP